MRDPEDLMLTEMPISHGDPIVSYLHFVEDDADNAKDAIGIFAAVSCGGKTQKRNAKMRGVSR